MQSANYFQLSNVLIKQKYLHITLVILLCQFLHVNSAIAHGGGLNASGCHNVRSTGGYHCHRAYYSPPEPKKRVVAAEKPTDKSLVNETTTQVITPAMTRDIENGKARVLEAQRYLDYLGYKIGAIDGLIGPKTRAAIQSYQRSRGVKSTGRITEPLLADMANEISKDASITEASKKSNVEDNSAYAIELAQIYLTILEFYTGPKNGLINTELEQAIMMFQKQHKMSVDGKPSPELFAMIKSEL